TPIFMSCFFFFFFQAEDGIRDRNVTGVQTCALPISSPNCPSPSSNSSSRLSMESLPSPSPKDSTTPIVKLWFQGVDFSPRFRQRTQCRQLLTELHKGKQPEDFLTMIRRGVPQKTARESSATRRTRSFRATISSPRLTSLDRRGQVIEEGAKAAIHSLCISSST